MDPDEALRLAREAAEDLQRQLDSEDPSSSAIEQEAAKLREHFTALDEWISSGGFLPADWRAP